MSTLAIAPLTEIHNTILEHIWNSDRGMGALNLFDRLGSQEMSPKDQAALMLSLTRAIGVLEREGLIAGDRQCYTLTRLGKLHLLGLTLWSRLVLQDGFVTAGVHTSANLGIDAADKGADSVESAPGVIASEEARVQRVMEAIRKKREGKLLSFPEQVALRRFDQEVDHEIEAEYDGDGDCA